MTKQKIDLTVDGIGYYNGFANLTFRTQTPLLALNGTIQVEEAAAQKALALGNDELKILIFDELSKMIFSEDGKTVTIANVLEKLEEKENSIKKETDELTQAIAELALMLSTVGVGADEKKTSTNTDKGTTEIGG